MTNSAFDVPARPVSVADQRIGINGAIAAALTRWIGSMPALYVVLLIVGLWMALATWGPLRAVDPYPFAFLLFLDNVVQLILCLVILVGQRVPGMAADRRAVQTYQSAEAIFEQVADLQAHLDRHDRTLSRGVSLLQSRPHPWMHTHRVQRPPQAIDQAVGVNGRIAAWLTTRLGSVWGFYLAAGTQVLWIGLAVLRVQRFDPYPFAFMTFMSTLTQLVFMVVIMVGQDVLGRAADRRSEQTFLDTEAILHECRRMKVRLESQDRVIDSLSSYTSAHVIEQLGRALHETRMANAVAAGEATEDTDTLRLWDELPAALRQPYLAQAQQIGEQLATIGFVMVPAFDPALAATFDDDQVQSLARLEHQRQLSEQAVSSADQPDTFGSHNRHATSWELLSDQQRAQRLQAVRRLPALLARTGFQVVRDSAEDDRGPGEADFTTAQWNTLQQAMIAAGVLVALAEGTADPEEIFALIKTLREASISHPRRFIRELAAASNFATGLRPHTRYAEYEPHALAVISSATTIVAGVAPTEVTAFQAFLAEIATAVADANEEGGFFGLGARRRYGKEAVAMTAVNRAAGISDGQR